MKVLAQLRKMIFVDVIVPMNEGSGGSNEILVEVGSKVWESRELWKILQDICTFHRILLRLLNIG